MSDGSSSTFRERLTSPLTWHWVGFAVLLVIAVVMAVRLGVRLDRDGLALQ